MPANNTTVGAMNQTAIARAIDGLYQFVNGVTDLVMSIVHNILSIFGITMPENYIWLISQVIIWGTSFWLVRRFVFGRLRLILFIVLILLSISYLMTIGFNFNPLGAFVGK